MFRHRDCQSGRSLPCPPQCSQCMQTYSDLIKSKCRVFFLLKPERFCSLWQSRMVDIVAEQKFCISPSSLTSWLKCWQHNRRKGGFGKSESLGVAGNRSAHPTFLSALQEQLDAVADFLCSEAQRRPPFGRHKETGKGPREEEEAREYVDRAREFCECLTG